LFRDEAAAARASIALIFLSFALAGLASRAGKRPQAAGSVTHHRLRLRATMLLVSIAVFVFGAAWAFEAQITVMGTGGAAHGHWSANAERIGGDSEGTGSGQRRQVGQAFLVARTTSASDTGQN
jgi:hypothetical protein